MSTCLPCQSIDCDFPSDLELYSLQGLQFFLNGQLYPIIYCPPGFDCNPLASGFIYFQCCAHTLQRGVSGGMPYTEIQALVQSMVSECQGLGCGDFPPGKPVVQVGFYFNKAQTAEFFCPDLSGHFYTCPAGTFVATSQAAADALAMAFANKNLASLGACIGRPRLTGSPGWICVNTEVSSDLSVNVYRITGSNSAANYNWSISDGALPAGVTLVDMGHDLSTNPPQAIAQLQGTPTVPGFYSYTVQAVRPGFPQSLVQVNDTFAVFGITNDALPYGVVGTFYSQQLLTNGGTPPVTFSLHSANAMPPGLTLHPDGTIDGTPTGPGVSGFEVDITDADGGMCTQTVTLTIYLCFTNGDPPDADVVAGHPYSFQFIPGPPADPAYTFSISSGVLPPGLSLNATTGVVSGQATVAGVYPFSVSLGGEDVPCSTPFTITAKCQPTISDVLPVMPPLTLAGTGTVTIGPFYFIQRTGAYKTLNSAVSASWGASSGMNPEWKMQCWNDETNVMLYQIGNNHGGVSIDHCDSGGDLQNDSSPIPSCTRFRVSAYITQLAYNPFHCQTTINCSLSF